MIRRLLLCTTLCCISFCAATAGADDSAAHSLTAADQANHVKLKKLMSAEQIELVSSAYPNFRILKLCPGHFSGQKQEELVLGIWKPVESSSHRTKEVHRIGLIRSGEVWKLHIIDDELEVGQETSNLLPMEWQYAFAESGFAGEMKCGIESEFGEASDLTYLLGDKPLFNLKKNGLENNKVSCFATSDVYNNWDCVVYSPKDNRFKLWFQQAHAD